MKKFIYVLIVLCCGLSLANAGGFDKYDKNAMVAAKTMTLNGTIIDNMCANAQKPENMAGFTKTHTKECALKCASSGYAIYADGKIYKFNGASNGKIEEFLKKGDSKTQVTAVVNKVGDEVNLISIKG